MLYQETIRTLRQRIAALEFGSLRAAQILNKPLPQVTEDEALRAGDVVYWRNDQPCPAPGADSDHGYIMEGADTPSTGYRGGMGYGWLGYTAGHIRPLTVAEYVAGKKGLQLYEAEATLAQQKAREAANHAAFHAYMNA